MLPTDAPGDGLSGVVAVSPQRPMSLTSDAVTPEMRLQRTDGGEDVDR